MMASRLSSHLSIPLFKNGYALAANTIITAGLGAAYWVFAARLFSTENVGVGSALIAAMTFLTSLTQLNLNNALNRFIPSAGSATKRLLVGSYAVAVPLSGVAAIVFLAGINIWAPGLDVIVENAAVAVGFVVATMAWTLFVLQDSALAGLRRATWIPVENGAYGLAKIGLLAILAGTATGVALFMSWTLPLVLLIIPVNILIFRKAIPEHVAASVDLAVPFDVGAVVRFAGADYAASLMWMATTSLLPIVVLEVAGAEANAYFYLSWTIAYTLYLVSRSTGVSLITEGALEPAKLTAYSRRVVVQTGALIVPAVAVLVVAAPLVLRIFGPEYSQEGSTLLRLLALSAIPNMIVTLYVSIARVERRMRSILVIYTVLGALVIGLTALLLPRIGINGVGWAWLVAELAIATALLLTTMRPLWVPLVLDHPLVAKLASLVGTGRKLDRESAAAAAKLPELLAAVGADPALGGGEWHVVGHLPTDLEVVVASLESASGPKAAVAKLATAETASNALRWEAEALGDLRHDARLGDWVAITPELYTAGSLEGSAYFVEERIPGRDARDLLSSPDAADHLLRAAGAAIAPLHDATAEVRRVGDAALVRWIDEPIADLGRLLGGAGHGRRLAGLGSLEAELRAALDGNEVTESWIHGDYWLGNLLVDGDLEVAGIIDWGQTERRGLPQLDFGHLVLTTRVSMRQQQFGQVVIDAMVDPDWSAAEAEVLSRAAPLSTNDVEALRLLVLLTWLRHVASNVRKSGRYRTSWLWMAHNVDEVLGAL